MKKYALSLAAVLTVALVAAGGAFAKGHPSKGLTLDFVPRPQAWLKSLREFPRDPKPLHTGHVHRPAAHEPASAKHRHHPAKPASAKHHGQATKPAPAKPRHHATDQPARSTAHRRGTTLSIYEQTARTWFLSAQGCNAAKRRDRGVVVLDFGMPAFEHHRYGTILFSGRFAPNPKITTSMVAWARGYVRCLPKNSTAFVMLARGTSNYHPAVPSVLGAGRRWALATVELANALQRKGFADHVGAAAADDAEPSWDPRFRKTREFISGFRRNAQGHTLYDYGSLDGGVGAVWSAKQAFFVAGGIHHTAALPEIYNHAMAREWAELESIARNRFHSHVRFAGVMTQGSQHCGCSLGPRAAHHALARALAAVGVAPAVVPQGGTNISG